MTSLPGDIEMEMEDRPVSGREGDLVMTMNAFYERFLVPALSGFAVETHAEFLKATSSPPKAGLPNHPEGGK